MQVLPDRQRPAGRADTTGASAETVVAPVNASTDPSHAARVAALAAVLHDVDLDDCPNPGTCRGGTWHEAVAEQVLDFINIKGLDGLFDVTHVQTE